MNLRGKVSVITGGASGMGEACAQAFSEAGMAVVIGDRDEVRGEVLAAAIKAKGGGAIFVKTDVTDERSIEAMVQVAIDRFGGLDCAVNCAGVAPPQTKIVDYTAEKWRTPFDIMMLGVALSMKYEIAAMLKRGGGSIVNIASEAGIMGIPRMGAYVAAKHGVVGISKTAALECALDGIRVNSINPGPIETPMLLNALGPGADRSGFVKRNPMGRLGHPSEIADVALWLVSSRSSFVTGQSISVDGGMTAGPVEAGLPS